MPLPPSLSQVTIHGKYTQVDGAAASGTVSIVATATGLVGADHVIVPQVSRVAALDASGAISVVVPALDDPDLVPAGMRYLVVEAIVGAPARAYYIDAPAATAVINLDTATQALPGPALTSYLLASTLGQVGGPGGPLDATGKMPAAQIPATGGGAPATRVIATTAPLAGGGDLTADRTLTVAGATAGAPGVVQLAGDLGGTSAAPLVPGLAGKVPNSRLITAGAGLLGGGDLTADRTLSLAPAADAACKALGLVAQTVPPALASTQFAVAGGTLVLVLVYLPGLPISTLGAWVHVGGVTPNGVNGMALYTAAGVLVDKTGDMSAAFGTGAAWASGALLGGVQTPAAGAYYLAFLDHFGAGNPALAAANAVANIPAINGKRPSIFLAGQADFPANINPGAANLNSAAYYMTAH